jgi:membrane associated rhomboid family serine protease
VAAGIALVMATQQLGAMWLHRLAFPVLFGRPSAREGLEATAVTGDLVHAEPWRLLTAAFVHDGLLHFAMNVMALLALGRMIEMFAHRAYVPTVFLLAALASSGASAAFSGGGSVGASGAVMGLFGFLAVMARRRRDLMPPGFGRAILIDISVIALIGVVGYGYVDNWAHGGGFACGAFLGWLMIPHGGRTAYWEPSRAIRAIGDVSLGLLLAVAVGTVGVLARHLFF